MDRNTPVCPSSHNGWTGLGQNTLAHSSSAACRVATPSQNRGSTEASTGAQGNAQNAKDSSALQCFRCQSWGHMARECATPAKPLNKDGGNQGNAVNPHITQSINLQHSSLTPMKNQPIRRQQRGKDGSQLPLYHSSIWTP